MTRAEMLTLRVVLLALLPTYGQAATTLELAATASASRRDVHEALEEPLQAGQVRYDLLADTYAAVKQGDAL
ncbi:hypothetical protein [Acidovorax sp.]|uniref:hypothetical protein n=1 Tax=Acidovorax sp. TaxID=1872122 RepID=UPI002ACEB7EF|nr:hypothetical protein [Acidovorax sp.]MDZ7862641.1 hypothetical protein [Acidovorax sp.]